MAIKYRLSRKQHKETDERGRALRIIIPLPDDADEDAVPIDLTRALLDVPPAWIRDAEILEIPVCAPLTPGGSGLAGLLGDLAHTETRGDRLVYRVICLSAIISRHRSPRHDARGQWPGSVEIEGRIFPEE